MQGFSSALLNAGISSFVFDVIVASTGGSHRGHEIFSFCVVFSTIPSLEIFGYFTLTRGCGYISLFINLDFVSFFDFSFCFCATFIQEVVFVFSVREVLGEGILCEHLGLV